MDPDFRRHLLVVGHCRFLSARCQRPSRNCKRAVCSLRHAGSGIRATGTISGPVFFSGDDDDTWLWRYVRQRAQFLAEPVWQCAACSSGDFGLCAVRCIGYTLCGAVYSRRSHRQIHRREDMRNYQNERLVHTISFFKSGREVFLVNADSGRIMADKKSKNFAKTTLTS